MKVNVDELLELIDDLVYADYCRLITILYWNL